MDLYTCKMCCCIDDAARIAREKIGHYDEERANVIAFMTSYNQKKKCDVIVLVICMKVYDSFSSLSIVTQYISIVSKNYNYYYYFQRGREILNKYETGHKKVQKSLYTTSLQYSQNIR